MTNINKLVKELEGKFYDVPAYDIRQILNYLRSHGYLKIDKEPVLIPTKFKVGDKVRRTARSINGLHKQGTVDTIVEVTLPWVFDSYFIDHRFGEGFYSENNAVGDRRVWCSALDYELVDRMENKND